MSIDILTASASIIELAAIGSVITLDISANPLDSLGRNICPNSDFNTFTVELTVIHSCTSPQLSHTAQNVKMSDTATTKELYAPIFTTNPTTVEYSFTVGGSVVTWVTVPSYVALQEKVSIEIKTFENLDLEVGVLELTIIAVAKDSK